MDIKRERCCLSCPHIRYDRYYEEDTGEEVRVITCALGHGLPVGPYTLACEDYGAN